jgi:ABC-type multidrug transport system permease subunit
MTGIIRQYRTELRNIFILALILLAVPYLPAFASLALTAKGLILSASIMGAFVLAMVVKLYFRILVLRITKEN